MVGTPGISDRVTGFDLVYPHSRSSRTLNIQKLKAHELLFTSPSDV